MNDRIDAVLLGPPPAMAVDEVIDVAHRAFGVIADTATDLGSERDRAVLLCRSDQPIVVVKVSNAAEDPDVLDMEAGAALHALGVDPTLPIARPRHSTDGHHRVPWQVDGVVHWVRCYDVCPGDHRADPRHFGDRSIGEWGTVTARLGRALRGFIHPRAIRVLPWDVQHASRVRPMVAAIADPQVRAMVTRALDRFDDEITSIWSSLRAQVVHGDLTVDNALVDGDLDIDDPRRGRRGRITGIVDFGDMSHTALLVDVVSALDSLTTGRRGADLMRTARLLLDGYQRVTPLEAGELAVIGELWAARLAVGLAIGSWRAAEGLEDPAFATRFHETATDTLDHLLTTGWHRLARELAGVHDGTLQGEPDDPVETSALIDRRAVFGPATEALSYDEPIRVERATGTWLIDTANHHYLDCYNNVPCIGHAHPRVTEAIARQSRLLNTNLRYLHPGAIELAERLVATCPPSLDTVFFVNSGSEANDLAWRLATTFTGNTGGLCTTRAYHGISAAIAPLSPETLPPEAIPPTIDRWEPTDTYRGLHTDSASFQAAITRLDARGVAPALAILDGVLQSDGVHDLAPSYVRDLVALTHAAGGLWVADEVQGGHGRTGEAMWSFQRFGIVPDIVTLGKPMGNGHPVAAVITRRDIAERFAEDTVFFSTFGGNQVSVAAAHAVLDVLDDERVLPRVVDAGEALRAEARRVCADVPFVGDVRGIGLANAIEIVTDRHTTTPDPAMADRVKNGLREQRVLVGTTGVHGNVLKIRPPLAFTVDEVPMFAAALAATLRHLLAD